MTPENDTLDNIRKAWINMGESLGYNIPDNIPTERLGNMKTALDRLAAKYRTFSIVSALMIITSSLIFSRPGMVDCPWNIRLPLAYSAYFFITFLIDHWFYNGIRSMDPLTMSVSEVARKALFYKKRHLQAVLVLLPLAITLAIITGYAFSFDSYMLAGMAAGALAGLAIGITQLTAFMRHYRRLSE